MQKIIWITGLSGSGKSTLGSKVVEILRDRDEAVVYLDGDQLREVFGLSQSAKGAYTREMRILLAMQYSRLCHILSSQGFIVVIATISMFKEIHEWNRSNLENYFEVFLKVSIEELRKRNSKKIYSDYESGKLQNVAGLDLPVDEPKEPNLLFNFDEKVATIEMAEKIVAKALTS